MLRRRRGAPRGRRRASRSRRRLAGRPSWSTVPSPGLGRTSRRSSPRCSRRRGWGRSGHRLGRRGAGAAFEVSQRGLKQLPVAFDVSRCRGRGGQPGVPRKPLSGGLNEPAMLVMSRAAAPGDPAHQRPTPDAPRPAAARSTTNEPSGPPAIGARAGVCWRRRSRADSGLIRARQRCWPSMRCPPRWVGVSPHPEKASRQCDLLRQDPRFLNQGQPQSCNALLAAVAPGPPPDGHRRIARVVLEQA